MRTCSNCGFDKAPVDEPCPLCGLRDGADRSQDDTPTVGLPAGAPIPARGGRWHTYPAGHVYGGRFRIVEMLGRGGMGAVYRVHDQVEPRELALKILLASDTDEEDAAERFQREIEILAKIRHPGVPRVFGWGTHDRERFFVCELVEGKTLKAALAERGPWPAGEVAGLGAAIADALDAAHRLGVVHRDVKPHNVMLTPGGEIRLLDFGVARGVGLDMKTITKTGMIVGTPEYMSPEQLDSHRVDARSDLYSLGVVMFELATGRLPFTGETAMAIAMQHLSNAAPLLRSVRPDAPAWLERILARCLEKSPAKRYESAAELAAELRIPHAAQGPSHRRLPNGDVVVLDPAAATDWALVLQTPQDHRWAVGAAVRFEENFYKLVEVVEAPRGGRPVRTYRFVAWPSSELLRGFVDYDPTRRTPLPADDSLAAKLRKWIPGSR